MDIRVFGRMSKFCDFNDDGAMICDIAISRPDVSRRLTERLTSFARTIPTRPRREGEREARHRVYYGDIAVPGCTVHHRG